MSLNFLKREKNFIGVLEKGYPRIPEDVYSLDSTFKRIKNEVKELEDESDWIRRIHPNSAYAYVTPEANREAIIACKKECADISNLVDQFFELLTRAELTLMWQIKMEMVDK